MDIYSVVLSPWFWLAVFVVFTLIEFANSFNLITIWFAISAFFMIFISGLTGFLDDPIRFKLHLGVFLAMSIALLIYTRPLAMEKFKVGKTKTNFDDLVGREALVTKEITKHGKGEIKIKGQIWTAVSEGDERIEENSECFVVKIEGVKLVVRKKIDSDGVK